MLSAVARLDSPERELPGDAARVSLPDLLDDEVDVTPGRHTGSGGEPSGAELSASWQELTGALGELTALATHLSGLTLTGSGPRTTATVGDLVKAGALTLHAGQQPSDTAPPSGTCGTPLLTVPDLLLEGAPGRLLAPGAAHTVAEEGDVIVAGVVRAFRAWIHQGPAVALGSQLYALRVDPEMLDAHFLAGCLRAPANGRQAGTHASSSSRVDVRRLQVLRLPLDEQAAHADAFRRLTDFERLLKRAGEIGGGLVNDAGDRIASGGLTTARKT
ncbi:hypothetical protein ACFVH0_29295 [Streptomyces sp. NPDC127117]|uniref:hypothetical protein n=1 Tax=Streptomyces sp. NPDC127117 TaxID=3345368 RepID=UPI0036325597